MIGPIRGEVRRGSGCGVGRGGEGWGEGGGGFSDKVTPRNSKAKKADFFSKSFLRRGELKSGGLKLYVLPELAV